NGEQKSCRELATLQQWIIAGVVTRESLISRTGKTWKRLGDIGELVQYFEIADEAKTTRSRPGGKATPSPPAAQPAAAQPAPPPPPRPAHARGPAARPPATQPRAPSAPPVAGRGTMIGVSGGPQAAGGTILPDDDPRARAMPPKIPPGARTPPMGSVAAPQPP